MNVTSPIERPHAARWRIGIAISPRPTAFAPLLFAGRLEQGLAQLLNVQAGQWKDWRLAVAKAKRTELAHEVDAAAREIREADRRQAPA